MTKTAIETAAIPYRTSPKSLNKEAIRPHEKWAKKNLCTELCVLDNIYKPRVII